MRSIFQHTASDFFNPSNLFGALTYGVILLLLALLGARLVGVAAAHGRAHLSDRTAFNFVTQFVRVAIFAVAFIIYCYLVPPLRTVGTTLLAGAGVVSIIIGLAAQNTLGNVIAGFSLVIYRPFRVGDFVRINTSTGVVSGTVKALSLGYTTLQSASQARIVVPNSVMSSTVLFFDGDQ